MVVQVPFGGAQCGFDSHPPLSMPDPKLISLDIETYGKVEGYPEQTVFHPARSLFTDRVPLKDLILTCSITLPERDPRCETNPPTDLPPSSSSSSSVPSSSSNSSSLGCGWTLSKLRSIAPGPTMVFRFDRPEDRKALATWIRYADTIAGMNLPFDLMNLRRYPEFRFLLGGQHTLLDLSYFIYLQSETRGERSLKTIGPVLGTHIYEEGDLGRFPTLDSPDLLDYNAQDTHNTLLAMVELARRMPDESDKLSPWCVQFYSDTFWSCLFMAEAGIPMSVSRLTRLEAHLTRRMERIYKELEPTVKMSGEGSQKSKDAFLAQLLEAAPGVRGNRLLQLTKTQRKVAFSDENRNLIKAYLPPDHPYRGIMKKIGNYNYFQKLVSDYTYPLLRHSRKDESKQQDRLIPPPASAEVPDTWLAYPTWYPVPSPQKDSGGDEGGTIQGRITCKHPKGQTFPPVIKDAEQSRFADGVIVSMDLSQIELRVAALLSGDDYLCRAYQQNLDLHGDRAVLVYGESALLMKYGDKYRKNPRFKAEERQDGKQLNFADLFLAQAFRMQRTIMMLRGVLMPIEFFQAIEDSRYSIRKGLCEWQYAQCCEAERRGYSLLPFTGQSRSFWGFQLDHGEWARRRKISAKKEFGGRGADEQAAKSVVSEIVNFPVQTWAGNTLLRIQYHVRRRLPHQDRPDCPCLPYINVYDALRFDTRRSFVPTLLGVIEEAVRVVATEDIWGMLQAYYNREVPLKYEVVVKE